MGFQFDEHKSRSNKKKHGIDFIAAQELWRGFSVEFKACSEFENRYAMIGEVGGRIYTCIYCYREDDVRLISCRRVRKGEKKLYEQSKERAGYR